MVIAQKCSRHFILQLWGRRFDDKR